jgi:hypothetical protein
MRYIFESARREPRRLRIIAVEAKKRSLGDLTSLPQVRWLSQITCNNFRVHLYSCDRHEISGSDRTGCWHYRCGGTLYAFVQQWRFNKISPLFVAMPACAAVILLNRESFLAGRFRLYGFVGLFLLVPVGLGLRRYVIRSRLILVEIQPLRSTAFRLRKRIRLRRFWRSSMSAKMSTSTFFWLSDSGGAEFHP